MTSRSVDGKYVLLGGQKLFGDLRDAWESIEQHIERFKSADVYLVSTPMWNFGIPYVLKQYIDILIQPNYLFRYVNGVPDGFLKGRKMIVVWSSGGDYSAPEDREYNHVEPYLRSAFGFVGIENIEFIRVQPLDGVEPEVIRSVLAQAGNAARTAAENLAATINNKD